MKRLAWRSEAVADDAVSLLQLVEQLEKRPERSVATAGSAQISHDAWHRGEIHALAVAMVQAREDAEHLELPLHAHPFEVPPEIAEVRGYRQSRVFGPLPVSNRPIELIFLVPCDVRVTQKRDEIVGDRAVDRILEIQHARVWIDDHEIARMVVTMHVDARLCEVVLEDETECSRNRGAL